MASIQHAYRRGAVYWWRRRLPLDEGRSASLYVSLRTRRPAEARRRAIALTLVSEEIRTHILDVSEPILSGEARKRLFQTALQRQLDRIIADQVETPQEEAAHRKTNLFFATLYRIWARRGAEAALERSDLEELRASGWSEADVEAFAGFARSTPSAAIISMSRLKELLGDLGVAPTGLNLRQATQIVCDARARACDEASRRAAETVPYGDQWAREVLGQDVEAASSSAPPRSPWSPAPAPAAAQERSEPTHASETLSAVLAAWQSTWGVRHQEVPTLKQYAQSVRLLARLIGDVAVTDLTEDLLELFVKRTERLRINYRMSDGDILVPEGHAGPSGISTTTLHRHLTGISVFLDWARRHHKAIAKIDFSALAPKAPTMRARDKRLSWTDGDCGRMLEAPPFRGCQGTRSLRGSKAVHQRMRPGPHIFHDAWFWILLLFYYTGARREEICKLLGSDVGEEDGIAFLQIRPTLTGRLKNPQSERIIPLHAELLRLGFLDFVQARKRIPALAIDNQGTPDWELFPELRPGGEADYGTMYYKRVWKHFLPGAMGAAAGERDIHSFRHGFSDFLDSTGCQAKEANDLFGHETATTRGKVYGERTPLARLAEIIALRRPITATIAARPLDIPIVQGLPKFVQRHRPAVAATRKALKRSSSRS